MTPCTVERITSRDARSSLYDGVLHPSFGPEELPPRDAFLAWTEGDQLEVLFLEAYVPAQGAPDEERDALLAAAGDLHPRRLADLLAERA